VVTTNVDGLETDSRESDFLPEDKVLRLHGRLYELQCKGHTIPLTDEMATALANQQPVVCDICEKEPATQANGREHLARPSADRKQPAPPMLFYNDPGDNSLGDADQEMFNSLFHGIQITKPDLVFVIGSSLTNAMLRNALSSLENATIYIVNPSLNANNRIPNAIVIQATADEWARRVNVYLDTLSRE
jgi:NAD-dependent SIR2 family protein deacetylase